MATARKDAVAAAVMTMTDADATKAADAINMR
jgi:hypothetical protein